MKQLVIGVLAMALISLGYRLVGTFTVTAEDAPARSEQPETPPIIEPNNPIQPAADRVDKPTPEENSARDDTTGPDRTRRGNEASQKSSAVPRSAAKPILGDAVLDLAAARTPPPAPPPQPRMVSPDGIVFHKIGPAPSLVSSARRTPPLEAETLVKTTILPPQAETPSIVGDDKPLSPEPPVPLPPTIAAARGKMIGPDGIEFQPVKRGH
jgi:hypothetical protein